VGRRHLHAFHMPVSLKTGRAAGGLPCVSLNGFLDAYRSQFRWTARSAPRRALTAAYDSTTPLKMGVTAGWHLAHYWHYHALPAFRRYPSSGHSSRTAAGASIFSASQVGACLFANYSGGCILLLLPPRCAPTSATLSCSNGLRSRHGRARPANTGIPVRPSRRASWTVRDALETPDGSF